VSKAGTRTLLVFLTLAALAVRLPALRALPVFGDEAVFLHLARLLSQDPAGNLWISLQVAMAPLHLWALALALPVSPDPVLAGRLLSVVAGAALVPALFRAATRIGALFSARDADAPGRVRKAALWAAAILAVSPFFVFSDRLARVDSLFALEVTVVAAVSIELAQAALAGNGVVTRGLILGLCMGITMLTRQAVSYALWGLPALAFLLSPGEGTPAGRTRAATRAFLVGCGVSIWLAAALWTPMLLVRRTDAPDLMTRIFHLPETHPAIGLVTRVELIQRNLGIALAAFGRYLTPPVCFLAVAGAVALTRPGRRRAALFLVGWEALLIAPTVFFAGDYFPRYALPAALPIVVAAGYGAAALLSRIRAARLPSPTPGILAAGFVGALFLWPLLVLARGERDWRRWPFLAIDRDQFVTGPQAGFATEQAIRFLESKAAKRPITVLTPEFSGNPTDAVWLYLADRPGVRLSYAVDALRTPLLEADPRDPNVIRLAGDLRARVPPENVVLPNGESVYAVSTDPLLTRGGWARAESVLAPLNPGLREVARFENPRSAGSGVANAVVVLRAR
jgi:4-amino-4-deoxy-L-arabinose transferase-like glycosyltransferase